MMHEYEGACRSWPYSCVLKGYNLILFGSKYCMPKAQINILYGHIYTYIYLICFTSQGAQ